MPGRRQGRRWRAEGVGKWAEIEHNNNNDMNYATRYNNNMTPIPAPKSTPLPCFTGHD